MAGEMEELARSANAEEIARAKAQLRAALLMGLERPSARAEQIAAHLLAYGRVVPISEIREKLEAVSVDDVREIGEKLMATAQPAIAAVGPCRRLRATKHLPPAMDQPDVPHVRTRGHRRQRTPPNDHSSHGLHAQA